jgi:hypothetical protein
LSAGAAAEGLGLCIQLDVRLNANHGLVFGVLQGVSHNAWHGDMSTSVRMSVRFQSSKALQTPFNFWALL